MNSTYLPNFIDYEKKLKLTSVRKIITDFRKKATLLLEKNRNFPLVGFDLVLVLDDISEEVSKLWGIISHLNNTVNSKKIRNLFKNTLNDFNNYFTFIEQNSDLYEILQTIKKSSTFKKLNSEEKKIVNDRINDLELNGVGLLPKKKIEFKKNNEKLLELSQNFSNNVLDDTDEYFLKVDNLEKLKGLPPSFLEAARQTAQELIIKKKIPSQKDIWVFTLNAPSYIPFMTYVENEKFRETLYRAFVTKATKGKRNNSPLIVKILSLRRKQAELLGFKNYAIKALKNRMAKTPQKVLDFLDELYEKTKKTALKEKQELFNFKKKKTNAEFKVWDTSFFAERIKEEKFFYDEEKIKAYFPYKRVIDGLFKIIEKLFDYSFVKVENDNIWHESVIFYNLYDAKKNLIGHLYMDLFSRSGKRGGAWMDSYISRKKTKSTLQLPVAYLVTNFSPLNKEGNSFLNHNEIVTLFHEMGHVLHHLLTKVDYLSHSGINGVPWDGVELPSQFLENWAWNKKSLNLLSEHYQTKKSLPGKDYESIIKSRNHFSALAMFRQLEFSSLDMKLHLDFQMNTSFLKLVEANRKKFSLFKIPTFNRWENSFTHIFDGGYAAGYYSYKWAEVLAADAFSVFQEFGIFNKKWSKNFLKFILEKGGSEDFMKLYKNFRGQAPKISALLKHLGI